MPKNQGKHGGQGPGFDRPRRDPGPESSGGVGPESSGGVRGLKSYGFEGPVGL